MKDKRSVKGKGVLYCDIYEFEFHYNKCLKMVANIMNIYNVFLSFRDLSHSRSMSFPEKKSYNPHVNIEYVDDKGRELTPKEVM